MHITVANMRIEFFISKFTSYICCYKTFIMYKIKKLIEMKTPHLDNLINDLKAYDRNDMLSDDGRNQLNEYEAIKRALSLGGVVGQSEQLVGFLRQYQKTCEIMHVNKIDAKNFVEQYKTN